MKTKHTNDVIAEVRDATEEWERIQSESGRTTTFQSFLDSLDERAMRREARKERQKLTATNYASIRPH